MSGTIGPARRASARPTRFAVSSEPVNATPATRGSAASGAPIASPVPKTPIAAPAGTPAACKTARARCATSGVCSAGFATTALPAASAAATCPVKIASGKFQGLRHANTPRPCSDSRFSSPAGPFNGTGFSKCSRACSA